MKVKAIKRSSVRKKDAEFIVEIEGLDGLYMLDITYDLGGWNYFTGEKNGRGYFFNVKPVELTEGPHYTGVSFMMFSGYSAFLEGAKRYAKKRFMELVDKYMPVEGEELAPEFNGLLAAVVEKNKEAA